MNRSRRQFLVAGASALGLAGVIDQMRGGEPAPRATSSDRREPNWNERLTVTVGPKGADLLGSTEKAIQAAVDWVSRLGGGTVRILPGEYRLRNAVYLASNLRLVGSGAESILLKEPSFSTKLALDSDWYDQEITVVDGAGFRLGDGVTLRAKNPHNGGNTVIKRTLVARSGNRFKLDKALRENLWLAGDAAVSSLFPVLSGEFIENVAIENLTIDGNRANNELLDGNYAGCIFLQDCRDIRIAGVEARNYHGDGISWQICHDVVVADCHSHDNSGLGLHPGSGSQRPVIKNNTIERNDIGIFFCWGVKHGLAVDNRIRDSRSSGISIGHRDTDNVIRKNEIRASGKTGILFRPERGEAFAPHRTTVEENRIAASGGSDGVAIDLDGEIVGGSITRNVITEPRGKAERIGIRIGRAVRDVRIEGNHFEGLARDVVDLRSA